MDCSHVRTWFLDAEDLRPENAPSVELREHMSYCTDCAAFVSQLTRLEQAWRDLEVPAEADVTRRAFLDHLPQPTVMPRQPRQRPPARQRWLVAALLFVSIGLATWHLVPAPQAVASPALIEELIDWNLHLAQTPSLSERSQIYANRQGQLRLAVFRSRLPVEERALADLLLANGSWLVANDDPLDEAERFSNVADRLVKRIESAVRRNEHDAADQYALLQSRVVKRGVSIKLVRLEGPAAQNVELKRRLEKVLLGDFHRQKQLDELLERTPDLKRKAIRKEWALGHHEGQSVEDLVFDLISPTPLPVVGQPLTYQIKLIHHGPTPLGKMQLVIELPEEAILLHTHGPTAPRVEGPYLIYRPLILPAAGAETVIEFQVKPLRSGPLKVRAELRSKQAGYQPLVRKHRTTIGDR